MKKIMAILLSLALLLGCTAGLAETAEKQSFGSIRINGEFTLKGLIPEGYTVVPYEKKDDSLLVQIIPDDKSRPEMVLSIAFDEIYADVERLNDLDETALTALEETFTITDPYAVITYDETAYGTRLLICRTLNDYSDYLDILSIYKGYMVEFVMVPGRSAAEKKLTDAQIASCIYFLSELDFATGAEDEVNVANATCEVLVTGFDKEAKTIDLAILQPYTYTEAQVFALKEDGTFLLGEEEVAIGTLQRTDESVNVNDEYFFDKRADGLYTVSLYDQVQMHKVKELTVAVPDSLKYTDQVDAETGEILEEPLVQGAEEFFAALEKAQTEGVAFDSQNVSATFDENGSLTGIERYYTPWQ